MKKSILIVLLGLIGTVSFGQQVSNTIVDSTLSIQGSLPFSFSFPVTRAQADSLYLTFHPPVISDAYDMTNSLPPNYVTNATVDYTMYLQAGMNTHQHVIMPNFPVLVNMTAGFLALTPQSNQTIDFQPYSLLIMKGNGLTSNYGFFKLVGLSNVTINNARLIGDLYTHTVPITGDFGHSMMIYGCKNITLNNCSITQSAGDGIYEARGGNGAVNSSNIVINNVTANYNGRNGISITGVDTLRITNLIAIGNNAASPYCGLDFEPNTNLDDMNAITVDGAIFRDNSPISNHTLGLGLSIGLKRLFIADASQKIANLNKVVNITLNNVSDCGSGVGIKVSQSIPKGSMISLTGQITVNNPMFSSEYSAANSIAISSTGLLFNMYNPTVYDSTGKLLSDNTALQFLLHNQAAGTNINNSLLPNNK